LVQESSSGYFIFTAIGDSSSNEIVASKKSIELGESYDGQVVVNKGLEAGDIVINEGFRNVLDGQFIQILK
jgi:multidrug efflux pump subunit AcrA (membrane-fusion protein)